MSLMNCYWGHKWLKYSAPKEIKCTGLIQRRFMVQERECARCGIRDITEVHSLLTPGVNNDN